MRTMTSAEAQNRFGQLLDTAQHEASPSLAMAGLLPSWYRLRTWKSCWMRAAAAVGPWSDLEEWLRAASAKVPASAAALTDDEVQSFGPRSADSAIAG